MRSQNPRRSFLHVTLLLLLVACVPFIRAQTPNTPTQNTPTQNPQTQNPTATPAAPTQTQTDAQSASRTVRLNVLVTDKSNHSVGDLRQEDFRVEEDGVPQTITQFAREELPVSYTLVVDNSGSLRSVFDYMLRVGGALVAANRPGDETSLVRFVGREQITLVQDFTSRQSALERGLSSMYVEGGQTALIDALYLSARRLAEQHKGEAARRRALVLLTDGEDRASYYKLNDLQKLLRKSDVQIFAVGIVAMLDKEGGIIRKSPREAATLLLNTLAQETGGRAFFPQNVKEIQAALNEIAQDLRTQYTLTYQSSNTDADGKFRKIQIKLNAPAQGGKRTVHARAGYLAPGGTRAEEKNDPNDKAPRLKSP